MLDNNNVQGKVIVISGSESFLAKSLVSKMQAGGLSVELTSFEIKEIEKWRDRIELIVLFMSEEIDEMTETLVYLRDLAGDLDKKMILIGDLDEHDIATKVITQTHILEWFKRPLVMDDLMKCITRYMEENTGENRKKTILIVDDDITYMRTVYEWLKDDFHVGMANNGVQAISYLARNKADLVLLDYEMPIANGPQVLEMLKNDSETGQIPVMFLTGHSDRESVLSVVGLSPADYLLKTITKEDLIKKLKAFLG